MKEQQKAQTVEVQTVKHTDVMACGGEIEEYYERFGKTLLYAIRTGRPTDGAFKSAKLKRKIATLLTVRNGTLKLGLIDIEGHVLSEHTISAATAGKDYAALWQAANNANNIATRLQKNGVVVYLGGVCVLN